MKSTIAICFAAAALSGCASPGYWGHGDWLDRVSVRPSPVIAHTPAEQQELRARAEQLRARAESVRVAMVTEKSREQRMMQLKELQEIGDDLRPVDYALRGGPMPYRFVPGF